MAHLERLRNSIIYCCLFLVACSTKSNKQQELKMKNINSGTFNAVNDVLFFNQQPFTGYVYTLFPNQKDTIQIQGYFNGKEHGIWKKYFPDGKLSEIREYNNGNKTGKLISWWPNGKKQREYLFENNEYNGTCKEWNETGSLILELNYKNGYENGAQKMFYDNGKIRANYVIVNGRRFGLLGTKNCINVSDSVFKN